MNTNGYARNARIRVPFLMIECGRCGATVHNYDGGSNITGEDLTGPYTPACGYCGAKSYIPKAVLELLG